MRFQGLAVVLGKMRWPELIAHPRKRDLGLDAYAPASETSERIGKGLAASITPKLSKISADAKTAKDNYPDLKKLLFVTAAKVGKVTQENWKHAIHTEHDIELLIIEREEILTLLMMPLNASLLPSYLYLHIECEPQVADCIDKTRRAAAAVTTAWARKIEGHPLVELTVVPVDSNGAESANQLALEQLDGLLSHTPRVVLEGPAGCGKTTTLIQIARLPRGAGTTFLVDLPAWTASRQGILDYIAGMPSFRGAGLTAGDLARVQRTEPFLFLLNGWNEIAESNSAQANDALRDLERDFPITRIIVATRTHHLTPPLPGSMRLRLLPLRPTQRAHYLVGRLGPRATELRTRIETDPCLDELTRTPFILSEVVSLFAAGVEIPTTKFGVLHQVLRLPEQQEQHRNALMASPLHGCHEDYLRGLATAMTQRGAVTVLEADARSIVADVTRELADRGQIARVGAPTVLATLTAHHVLELVDYPQTAFRFEHQQLQEYFAALEVHARLLDLRDDDDLVPRFAADYVNEPVWAEPLRMVAQTLAVEGGPGERGEHNIRLAMTLVGMALNVDLVLAGELAQLCGCTVWNEVRAVVGERLRAAHALPEGNYQQYSLAAMLATGAHDFKDIILPLFGAKDQQTRLGAYRLWREIRTSSLGPNWREQVRAWSNEARADFVSELLYHRIDHDIVAFAVADESVSVKKAAVSALMWNGSDDALTHVLESLDIQTFDEVARDNADLMPPALRAETVAAMRRFVETTTDPQKQLRTALDLIELGETGVDGVIRNAVAALPPTDLRKLGTHYLQPALRHLRNTDPAWASEWLAIQLAEGVLHSHEYWLPLATAIPEHVVEKYLRRLATEDLGDTRFDGMIAVVTTTANAEIAARVIAKLRDLQRKVDAETRQQHSYEWQVMRQLEALFRGLPDDVAAAGVISSAADGDPAGIKVTAKLLSRVARPNVDPLRVVDADLKRELRAYLTGNVEFVLRQDDFDGTEKANLSSSISQVGETQDLRHLLALIRADIERMRRAQAAAAAGDRAFLHTRANMSHARWHIAALQHLDPVAAVPLLVNLLNEPEYCADVAGAMAREYLPARARTLDTEFRYDVMWAARQGATLPSAQDLTRAKFTAALKAAITRRQEQSAHGRAAAELKQLATALATVDGRDSAAQVLAVISVPGHWDEYTRVDAAERLLLAGCVLPTGSVFLLADSILGRTDRWVHDSDKYLLRRTLSLCLFVDDLAAAVAKVRDTLRTHRLAGYQLRSIVTALGQTRSDTSVDLLCELARNPQTFEQCEDTFIDAFAAIDTPRAREVLLGFVDPDVDGIPLTRHLQREHILVARLAELAQRSAGARARLHQLCDRDLPNLSRCVVSRVMGWIGTPQALVASLNLIADDQPSRVPRGVWELLESAFVEQRPYGQDPNVTTQHARASNDLRLRLFHMAVHDPKRRKSASLLLGQIEVWRLEYGRPIDEPRHPDLASGHPWPPVW